MACSMMNRGKRMNKQTFYIMDCIEGCKKLIPDGAADFVFADPPFNIEFEGSGAYVYGVSTDEESYYEDSMTPEQYLAWDKEWTSQGYRVLRPDGTMVIMTGWNYRDLILEAAKSVGFTFINEVVWRYEFGVFTKKKYVTSHYTFLILVKGDEDRRGWTFNKQKMQEEDVEREIQLFLDSLDWKNREENVKIIANKVEEILYTKRGKYATDDFFDDLHRLSKRYTGFKHSCKLSEDVLMKFYSIHTNENDLIVDLFMGAGTSMLAAILMNRRYIGFEIREKYKAQIIGLVKKRLAEKREVMQVDTL